MWFDIELKRIHHTLGPDVQRPSHLSVREGEGIPMYPEEQELYMLCLCEQPLTGSGGMRRKKGKETFIGFFVSYTILCFILKDTVRPEIQFG